MSGKYRAWKEAAWVFLLSRLLFVTLTLFSLLVLPQLLPNYAQHIASEDHFRFPLYTPQSLLYSWLHWDAKAFLNISHVGYRHTPDVAFFPLWPLVQSIGALFLGDAFPASFYFAGLILSNLCFYVALVLFYHLLSKDFGTLLARRALFCLAFSPYALFYFAGYSESLFLVLCLAVFLLLRRGTLLDWWLAGIASFIAVFVDVLCTILARRWALKIHLEAKVGCIDSYCLDTTGNFNVYVLSIFDEGKPFHFSRAGRNCVAPATHNALGDGYASYSCFSYTDHAGCCQCS